MEARRRAPVGSCRPPDGLLSVGIWENNLCWKAALSHWFVLERGAVLCMCLER